MAQVGEKGTPDWVGARRRQGKQVEIARAVDRFRRDRGGSSKTGKTASKSCAAHGKKWLGRRFTGGLILGREMMIKVIRKVTGN